MRGRRSRTSCGGCRRCVASLQKAYFCQMRVEALTSEHLMVVGMTTQEARQT
jgi:hypothetical protein